MPTREPASVTSAKIARTGVIVAAVIALLGVMITVYWQNRSKASDPKESAGIEYIGHVIDGTTLSPISSAKITLSLENVPPLAYTDSEGVFRFTVPTNSQISGQIRVDAKGYQVYIRNITISPAVKTIEDIRLLPLAADISPTDTPRPTSTPNAELIALYEKASTPSPDFKLQTRTVNGIEQVWVPAGDFVAGDVSGIGYDDEKPFHVVYTDGFWIDRAAVTNAEYATCPESICSAPQKTNSHVRPNGYYGVPAYNNYPVIHVTWQQSSDFCVWRNGRLPTEAEFEKAAGWDPKTGQTLIYPWGNLSPTDEYANYDGIDRDTRPGGSYPKGMSPVGAYDMAGNVWEWVSDWYAETYYSDNQDWNNPTGPADGLEKVVKGASWFSNDTRWLRVSNRGKSIPEKVGNEFGFRCVFPE